MILDDIIMYAGRIIELFFGGTGLEILKYIGKILKRKIGKSTNTLSKDNQNIYEHRLKENDQRAIFKLEKGNIIVNEVGGMQYLKFILKNVTPNIATSIKIFSTESIVEQLNNTNWKRNKESKNRSVVITQYETGVGDDTANENGEFQYTLSYKTYNGIFLLICFKAKIKSIYGAETYQLFNVMIANGVVTNVYMETMN